MKHFFFYLILGLFFLVLQTSFISFVLPKHLQPDILLIIVFFVSFRFTNWNGVLTAFFLGYIVDLFSGSLLGTSSFSFVVISLLVYLLAKKIDFNSPYMRLIGGIILEAIYLFILLSLNYIFHESRMPLSVGSVVIPRVIITGLFSPFFIFIFERIE